MAVAVQPQRTVRRGLVEALLDDHQRVARDRLVGELDVRRNPPLLQQIVRGVGPHDPPVESRTVAELPRPPDRVDARQESPHPLPLVLRPELRPVPALPRIDRVAKAVRLVQRAVADDLGRNHRHLGRRKLERESVLLEDRGRRPASRPVELDHHRRRVLAPDLVHAVLVAVQRQHAPVAAVADGLDGLDHDVRRQRGVRVRSGT